MSYHPLDYDFGTVGVRVGPLDISAAIGVRSCAVLIKVTRGPVQTTQCRINNVLGATSTGCMASQGGASKTDFLFLTWTTSPGVLGDVTIINGSTTWTIMGWLDASFPATGIFGPGAYPATWTDASMPGADGLGIFKWLTNPGVGTTEAMMRASNETLDTGYAANRAEFTGTGRNFATCISDSGKVSIKDTGGESGAVSIEALMTDALLTFTGAVVYNSAPAAATWTEVDLSAYTGQVRGLALLRVVNDGNGGRQGVRRKGDTGEYVGVGFNPLGGTAYGYLDAGEFGYYLCDTDAEGVIEVKGEGDVLNITLLAFIPEATTPTFAPEPEGTALGVERIGGVAKDAVGFDVSSLELTFDPAGGETLTAISGGAVQSGWSGSVIQLQDAGQGPREVIVQLTAWPDTLEPGRLVSCSIDMDSNGGGAL